MAHKPLPIVLLLLALLGGCGEKDLIDDSLPSQDQIRSLVGQFQQAAADGDDEAACDLAVEETREGTTGVGNLTLPCAIDDLLWQPAQERHSFPDAEIVYITISRHDDTADVQLDNGTRLFLRRAGRNADGEWRIDSSGYRPSPSDWSRRLYSVP